MEKLLAFALPKFTLLSLFIKKPFLILTGVTVNEITPNTY